MSLLCYFIARPLFGTFDTPDNLRRVIVWIGNWKSWLGIKFPVESLKNKQKTNINDVLCQQARMP